MKRTLVVTLEVDLAERSVADRRIAAKVLECKPSELPDVSDIDASHMADLVEGAITNADDIFAGSEMYATITGVRVVKSGWKRGEP